MENFALKVFDNGAKVVAAGKATRCALFARLGCCL